MMVIYVTLLYIIGLLKNCLIWYDTPNSPYQRCPNAPNALKFPSSQNYSQNDDDQNDC